MSKGFFNSKFDINRDFDLEREFDLSREFYRGFYSSKDEKSCTSKEKESRKTSEQTADNNKSDK